MTSNRMNNGWKMTNEEWNTIRSGDAASVQLESGECRPARFVTGAFFTAKVIFEGKAEPTIVAAKNITLIVRSRFHGFAGRNLASCFSPQEEPMSRRPFLQ
jgi:hypothetical protein